MSDDFQPLILVSDETKIQVSSVEKTPFAVAEKKDNVYVPQVSGGFVRLFPSFYELNHSAQIDTKTKKTIKARGSFTRVTQPSGATRAEVVTTNEVYFIPLAFKYSRMMYLGAYNPDEKRGPDCQSDNGIVPQTNKFANSCNECEYSKWVGNTPPKCGEQPVILALDMTGNKIDDPTLKSMVTREAVTIQFKKSAIKAVKDLMKKLAESYPFDDGSFGPVDMTRFLIKMTSEPAIAGDKEATYSVPIFEIVGYVPEEFSANLLASLRNPVAVAGNKTVLEIFEGRKEPFEGLPEKGPIEVLTEPEESSKPAGPPPVNTVEVKAEVVEEAPQTVAQPMPSTTEQKASEAFEW